jgi:hypothetical protein
MAIVEIDNYLFQKVVGLVDFKRSERRTILNSSKDKEKLFYYRYNKEKDNE